MRNSSLKALLLILFFNLMHGCRCHNNHTENVNKPKENVSLAHPKNIGFDSVRHISKNNNADTIINVALLYYKQFRIEITEMVLNDSVSSNYANMFMPIPLSYSLDFYNGNLLIASKTIPYKIVQAQTYQMKKIVFLDNKIAEVRFVKSRKLNMIMVAGYGGCNSCNESTIYFTMEGSIAYFWYGNQDKTIKEITEKKIVNRNVLNDTAITKVFENIW